MSTQETLSNKFDSEMERNEELLTREEIKDSPFQIIGIPGSGFFGCLGQHRITKVQTTKEIVEKELKTINWNRIVQVVLVLIQQMNDQEFRQHVKDTYK